MPLLLLTLFCLLAAPLGALAHGKVKHESDAGSDRPIVFPDVAGYWTLVADLHTHSSFSDGHVWPRIRVEEAHRDGLDALAVTEHLEYQPHRQDLPHPDRNRSYEITAEAAADLDMMIIPGVEITRDAPAGHMNAIFVKDANALFRMEDTAPDDVREYYEQAGEWAPREALEAAKEQEAFVFWNHPFWTDQHSTGIAKMPSFHRTNAKQGLLHGIEIANGLYYSEEAFAIALKHGLTIIGTSDVHNLIDWDYPPHKGEHRPVTLIFARDRSQEAMKAALFERRTIVWFRNLLLGRNDMMRLLLADSLTLQPLGYITNTDVLALKFTNHSDARFILSNQSKLTFMQTSDLLEVPPHGELLLGVKPGKRVKELEIKFKVMNALLAPGKPATMNFDLDIEIKDISL